MATRFDLVLFDLDGTLVDSLPDIASAVNHALGARGLAPPALEKVRAMVGDGVDKLAQRVLTEQRLPGGEGNAAALAHNIVAFYEAHPCVNSRLYVGVPETLAALRRDPHRRIAVLTNKVGTVARSLVYALGISGEIDAVVGDGDGHPRKPDPAAAVALMTRFGVPPGRTIMIGDGVPDLGLARAAGIASAAAAWGYGQRQVLAAESPTFVLDAPGRIIDIA